MPHLNPSADSPPPQSLVDFVLRHMRVKTNGCSRQKFTNGFTLKPRTVPDYNFIYITQGRVIWEIADVPHELPPRTLILVRPGVPHRGWSETRHMDLISIHVEVALPGGQDVFEVLQPPLVQTIAAGARLDEYLRHAQYEFTRDRVEDLQQVLPAWGRLVTIEYLLLNHRLKLLHHRSLDPMLLAVLEKLNERIAAPTTLADLARLAGYSPQHLNRLFRRSLGVTPLQYLARMRMEHAATLLSDGKLTIKAIAQRVGFDDPYYFSRQFKSQFAKSPQQFRAALEPSRPWVHRAK